MWCASLQSYELSRGVLASLSARTILFGVHHTGEPQPTSSDITDDIDLILCPEKAEEAHLRFSCHKQL